jgi:hypothetical protein
MAQRTYEGDPIDSTMQHFAERDFDEEAEEAEVPSEGTEKGDISTEYGFLDDDDLSKREKVERLWQRSDCDYDEWGSLSTFYTETVAPVLDVSQPYCSSVVGELEANDSESEETNQESEQQYDQTQGTVEIETDGLEEDDDDIEQGEMYSREQIKHDVLKPLVFAKKFASGDELEALQEAEELIEVLLNKGDV